jgi:hypothetical protein
LAEVSVLQQPEDARTVGIGSLQRDETRGDGGNAGEIGEVAGSDARERLVERSGKIPPLIASDDRMPLPEGVKLLGKARFAREAPLP